MQIHNAVITGSFSYNGADLSNVTSSNQSSASLSTRVTQIEQVYATTGSNSFRATQSITGSLTVTGQIIAQTLNVQQVTSSIVFSSGSNNFGCDLNSRQTFTGSVLMTGSLIVNTTGPELQVNNNGVVMGNLLTDNHSITGSLRITGSGNHFIMGCNLGIGTCTPTGTYGKLSIAGGISILNDNNAKLEIGRYSSGASNSYIKIGSNSNSLRITNAADSVDLITFENCGNVGIGTTCPTEIFHLNSASTNAAFIRFQNTGGSGVYIGGRDNNMELYAGGSERARITSGGAVGIGVSPAAWTLLCAIQVRNVSIAGYTTGNTHIFYAGNNWYYGGSDRYIQNGFASLYSQADGSHGWYNASCNTSGGDTALTFCERMRINSCGNVGIGVTPSPWVSGATALQIGTNATLWNRASDGLLVLGSNSYFNGTADIQITTGTSNRIYFVNGSIIFDRAASTAAGSSTPWNNTMTMSANGSIGAPSGTNIYNASDLRLKKNIETISCGLNKITALNPVKFNWIDGFEPTEDSKNMLGFIAQEVSDIIPEAVESFTGNSLTVGEIVIESPLRVNEKFIIPVLVKAIQELKAEFDGYKATHP